MRDWRWNLTVVAALALALPACKGDSTGGVEAATAAPAEPATAAVSDGAGKVNERPDTPRSAEMAVMDGYEPLLKDKPGDVGADVDPAFDLTSAHAVDVGDALLLRIQGNRPMTRERGTDIRLWVEQGERLLTIEAKPDHPDRICELTPIGRTEGDEVKDCLELGETLDLRIPKERLPRWLKTDEAYFVSGVSTCCVDEAREQPYDEIDGAQQVWVFRGVATRAVPAGVGVVAAPAGATGEAAASAPAEVPAAEPTP